MSDSVLAKKFRIRINNPEVLDMEIRIPCVLFILPAILLTITWNENHVSLVLGVGKIPIEVTWGITHQESLQKVSTSAGKLWHHLVHNNHQLNKASMNKS